MRTNRKNKQSGQAILEAALVLPIFIFVGLGMIDLQWMVSRGATVEYIANETARCEAMGAVPCVWPNTPTSYAQQQAINMRMAPVNLTVVAPTCVTSCTVQVGYTFKPVGVWFPSVTIQRVGTAAIPPPPGP